MQTTSKRLQEIVKERYLRDREKEMQEIDKKQRKFKIFSFAECRGKLHA